MSAALLSALILSAISAQATVDNTVSDAFVVEDGGLRHVTSGFFCPSRIPDATLSASRLGAPGDATAEGAYCEYEEAGKPVAYLKFSRASGPPLTDQYCQSLPQALKLQMGPMLPGIRQYDQVGPWPEGLAPPSVDGEPIAPLTCALSRPPRIVIQSTAAFTRAGWTVTAIGTPIPPPCCNGHSGLRLIAKDMLSLVLIIETAASYRAPTT